MSGTRSFWSASNFDASTSRHAQKSSPQTACNPVDLKTRVSRPGSRPARQSSDAAETPSHFSPAGSEGPSQRSRISRQGNDHVTQGSEPPPQRSGHPKQRSVNLPQGSSPSADGSGNPPQWSGSSIQRSGHTIRWIWLSRQGSFLPNQRSRAKNQRSCLKFSNIRQNHPRPAGPVHPDASLRAGEKVAI